MNTFLDSFSEVIDAFEGAFHEAAGIHHSHGRTMKARDSIPPAYWSRIAAAAAARRIAGITLETLARIAAAKADGEKAEAEAARREPQGCRI